MHRRKCVENEKLYSDFLIKQYNLDLFRDHCCLERRQSRLLSKYKLNDR